MSLNVQYSILLLFTLICAGYSHPQCLDSQAPFTPEPDTPFQLCLEYQSFGCCNDDSVITQHYQGVMGLISASDRVTCGHYIQNILCQICSPYAAHLYDAEGSPTPKSFPSLCPSYLAGFTARCSHLIPYITLNPTAVLAPSLTYCYPDTLNSDNRTTNLGNINSEDNCDVLCVQEVANNFFPATSAKHANDGTHRLFLVEQRGMIWIYLSNFTKIFPPFLDWRPSIFARSRSYDERGLLDLAFHPEFRQNGRFYIYYTTRTEVGHVTRLTNHAKPQVSTINMNVANASNERVILDIPQPAFNHNGGSILFYQGFLYLFTGDGGKGGDPYGNGQNLNVLLGKALRIDVDVANRSYGIPNDNPFLSNPNARPEIYAYGLRNPWKCTLDRGDPLTGIGYGRIFCGDVGQDDFEELDIMERGGNYGWNQLEGHACFLHSSPCHNIHLGDYVPPIHVYDHSIGRSITGGFVYRGCESPNLNGAYIFGDWDNGRLFYLRGQSTGWSRRNICMGSADYCVGNGLSGSYARYISSFAEDEKGEVYIISSIKAHKDMQGGRMYKIVDPS
uniref:Glucose/Sorbosone dehydrogenase domain-containing protein n=1 Tax=Ciona savignyi TaxID=51511 RepID=H2ZES6_CIOSA